MHAQRLRQRGAKQGVANRHQRQCHRDFANLVGRRFHRQLPDEIAKGMEYRIKRLAVTRQNHPDREPARSIPAKGIEHDVDETIEFELPMLMMRYAYPDFGDEMAGPIFARTETQTSDIQATMRK